MAEFEAREFRIGKAYRRLVVLVSLSLWLSLSCARWSRELVENGHLWKAWAVTCALLPVLLPILLMSRWRLILDADGITRHRGFGSDRWLWEDFASGRMGRAANCSYRDPARKWGRRVLTFAYLEVWDRILLDEICRRFWIPSPVPQLDLPDEINIKYSKGFLRKRLQVSARGLHYRCRSDEHLYSWQDVKTLRIRRAGHEYRDFRELELFLPDRIVPLQVRSHNGQRIPTWSGASAEVLSGFLQRHVLPERIQIIADFGPPKTSEEARERIAVLDRTERTLRLVRRILVAASILLPLPPLALLVFAVGWFPQPFLSISLGWLLSCVPMLLPFWMMWFFGRVNADQSRAELEIWQSAMVSPGSSKPEQPENDTPGTQESSALTAVGQ